MKDELNKELERRDRGLRFCSGIPLEGLGKTTKPRPGESLRRKDPNPAPRWIHFAPTIPSVLNGSDDGELHSVRVLLPVWASFNSPHSKTEHSNFGSGFTEVLAWGTSPQLGLKERSYDWYHLLHWTQLQMYPWPDDGSTCWSRNVVFHFRIQNDEESSEGY
jgi:hypothetical protein